MWWMWVTGTVLHLITSWGDCVTGTVLHLITSYGDFVWLVQFYIQSRHMVTLCDWYSFTSNHVIWWLCVTGTVLHPITSYRDFVWLVQFYIQSRHVVILTYWYRFTSSICSMCDCYYIWQQTTVVIFFFVCVPYLTPLPSLVVSTGTECARWLDVPVAGGKGRSVPVCMIVPVTVFGRPETREDNSCVADITWKFSSLCLSTHLFVAEYWRDSV